MIIERTIKEVQNQALEDGSLPPKWPNISKLSGPKLANLCVAIRLKRTDLANKILKEFLEGGDKDETK